MGSGPTNNIHSVAPQCNGQSGFQRSEPPAPMQEGPPLARRPLVFPGFFQLRSENELELELDDSVPFFVSGDAEVRVYGLSVPVDGGVGFRIEHHV